MFKYAISWLCAIALLVSADIARAAFHLWQVNEVFSNADGTVQFIELVALAGGQQFLAGHAITSSQGATTNSFTFPSNLPGDTAGKTFLIGTNGFAALGQVAPDYVVPNGFLFTSNGSVSFAGVDTVSWTALPVDGTLSINRSGTTAVKSPSGFAGSTTTAVNGACGTSNGITLSFAPSTGLCTTAGAASAVSGTGPWTWSCPGSNGGATASCSAALAPPLVDGACGTSNGTTVSSMPSSGLCASAGAASAVSGTGPWTWLCSGSNGGSIATCSARSGEVQVGSAINADSTSAAISATTIAFGLTANQLPAASGSEISREADISLSVTIAVDATDREQSADLLAVALVEPAGLWFMLTGDGWQPWSTQLADLRGHSVSVRLQGTVNIDLASQLQLPAADYSIFSGYRLASGRVVYNSTPMRFTVR